MQEIGSLHIISDGVWSLLKTPCEKALPSLVEVITIPKQFYLDSYSFDNISLCNFVKILEAIRYWNITLMPYKILDFIFKNKKKVHDIYIENFQKEYFNESIVIYFQEIDIIIKKNNFEICDEASKIGSLNLLKAARKNNCVWSNETSKYIAINGNLDCLKYAYENNCFFNEDICNTIATHGHIDCLKYVLLHNFPCNKYTCLFAAKEGNLDILKYLFTGFDNINIIDIKTNLWYVDENEWDKLDEIKELINHIQQK